MGCEAWRLTRGHDAEVRQGHQGERCSEFGIYSQLTPWYGPTGPKVLLAAHSKCGLICECLDAAIRTEQFNVKFKLEPAGQSLRPGTRLVPETQNHGSLSRNGGAGGPCTSVVIAVSGAPASLTAPDPELALQAVDANT
jgi:hypothetical protein